MERKINTVKAWSYSALAGYESCPRQHKYRKIDKLPEPKATAMFRGIKIHEEIGHYLAGDIKDLPASGVLFKDQMLELRDMNPIVEQKWAFTKGYKSVSWFDKKVKLRVVCDASLEYSDNTGEVIDHKTGKYREDDHATYDEQMELFAAAMFKRNHLLTHVTTRLWFLDQGEEVVREITKDQALLKLDELEDRAEVMMTTESFPPNPSWKCRFCHFSKSQQGQCEFG